VIERKTKLCKRQELIDLTSTIAKIMNFIISPKSSEIVYKMAEQTLAQEQTTNSNTKDDPFDSLLSLEEQYHAEGLQLGISDGARAGRNEGRVFGLHKGFEKALEMGRLHGKATVLHSRFPAGEEETRLNKQVSRLHELTDPKTISTINDEEAVSDFDSRLQAAQAKMRLVSNLLGEDGEIAKEKGKGKATGEMEDFVGLPAGKGKGS
jgi:flagellar biosynthesis/type III secretory pathway protein FliH